MNYLQGKKGTTAVSICTTTPATKGRESLTTTTTPQHLKTRTMPGKPYFNTFTRYPIHRTSSDTSDTILYTGHHPIHQTLSYTPDIILYTGHYPIHRTSSDTPNTILYTGHYPIHRQACVISGFRRQVGEVCTLLG